MRVEIVANIARDLLYMWNRDGADFRDVRAVWDITTAGDDRCFNYVIEDWICVSVWEGHSNKTSFELIINGTGYRIVGLSYQDRVFRFQLKGGPLVSFPVAGIGLNRIRSECHFIPIDFTNIDSESIEDVSFAYTFYDIYARAVDDAQNTVYELTYEGGFRVVRSPSSDEPWTMWIGYGDDEDSVRYPIRSMRRIPVYDGVVDLFTIGLENGMNVEILYFSPTTYDDGEEVFE